MRSVDLLIKPASSRCDLRCRYCFYADEAAQREEACAGRMPDEAAETERIFDLLLGDNLAGRKEYIAENGADYLELADIS